MWIDLNVPLENCDYFVYVIPFDPGPSHAAVASNPDGTYSLYLDANATREQQEDSYWHDVEHLACDDFDNNRPITDIENITPP